MFLPYFSTFPVISVCLSKLASLSEPESKGRFLFKSLSSRLSSLIIPAKEVFKAGFSEPGSLPILLPKAITISSSLFCIFSCSILSSSISTFILSKALSSPSAKGLAVESKNCFGFLYDILCTFYFIYYFLYQSLPPLLIAPAIGPTAPTAPVTNPETASSLAF